MEAVIKQPTQQRWRWPLGWLFVFVLLVAGSLASWFVFWLLYSNKLKSDPLVLYIFLLGTGLLLDLH